MVSISNSLGSSAYSRSAQLGSSRSADPAPSRPEVRGDQKESGVRRSDFTQEVQRTSLPEDAKAASNDARRFRDNPVETTAQSVTLKTEAQRGSLLDMAV